MIGDLHYLMYPEDASQATITQCERLHCLSSRLERAYPRPRYLLPTAFGIQFVLLCLSNTNAVEGKLLHASLIPRLTSLLLIFASCLHFGHQIFLVAF